MGIINRNASNFLGGVADVAKTAALAQFSADIQNERDTAQAKRNRTLEAGKQRFQTSERVAGEKTAEGVAAKKQEYDIAKIKAKPVKATRPQLIKYTDPKGYEQEGVLRDNGDGTYNIVQPDSGQIIEENITNEQLKNKAAQINVSEGRDRDWVPFNEYSPKDERVRAEVLKEQKGGGLINSAAGKKPSDKTKPVFVSGAKFPEGMKLTKEGKTYIVKNGKPVLVNE